MWIFEHNRIALARESRGTTQTDLAKAVGSTQQQVSQWESGDICPGQESLTRICNALSIEPRFFFVRSGTLVNPPLPIE